MPFRSLRPFQPVVFSWRRLSAVVVLALVMIVAPQAAELCGTACARTAGMAVMPAASAAAMPAGHCGSHVEADAASRHAAHAAHACGMPAHALPVQVDGSTATVASSRAHLAQLPQPTQTAMLPASAAALSTVALSPHLSLGLPGLRLSAGSTRSPLRTLALRI